MIVNDIPLLVSFCKTLILSVCLNFYFRLFLSGCSGSVQADIIFVLDASGSVGTSNFETVKQFIRDLVDAFEIGPNNIRVGVEKYSTVTNTEFDLKDYLNKKALGTRIMSIPYTGGTTNTGEETWGVRVHSTH